MTNQVDWTKVSVVILLVAGGGYAVKARISVPDWHVGTVSRPSPAPPPEAKELVGALVLVRGDNPVASTVLASFFADFAWLIANGTTDTYLTGTLERQLDNGGRQLLAMKDEVGDSSLSPAINRSLDELWGTTSRKITKQEAAAAIYAVAWGLR